MCFDYGTNMRDATDLHMWLNCTIIYDVLNECRKTDGWIRHTIYSRHVFLKRHRKPNNPQLFWHISSLSCNISILNVSCWDAALNVEILVSIKSSDIQAAIWDVKSVEKNRYRLKCFTLLTTATIFTTKQQQGILQRHQLLLFLQISNIKSNTFTEMSIFW